MKYDERNKGIRVDWKGILSEKRIFKLFKTEQRAPWKKIL
jgi:hypothetical protein